MSDLEMAELSLVVIELVVVLVMVIAVAEFIKWARSKINGL